MEALFADALTLVSVVVIDLVLAGDNAIVVGMVACGLDPAQQRRVIVLGIAAALICRIVFAAVAVQLLAIIGLMLAGGLLLLWVSWKLWREIRVREPVLAADGAVTETCPPKTFSTAVVQVAIADVSMSLDNVLAVAGAAHDHVWMLVFGLVLSVALMGLAATMIARVLVRYHWLNYIGLGIITLVALSMIYEGAGDVYAAVASN